MCVCVCTKRQIRNEGRIVFYSERGVHLVKSEDHLRTRIICGSSWYFMNVEITMVELVVVAVVTVRLEGSISCWCRYECPGCGGPGV